MAKHILCADDSVTMQQVVAITFGQSDYTVHAVRNADDALALAKQTPMELVLADAVMPGKSGYDLCQALKSDAATRSVPVVILCGNSQAYDDARGKAAGADAHVTKPWDTQVMIDKIAEILARVKQNGVAMPAGAAGGAARPAAAPVTAAPAAATPAATPRVATPAPAAARPAPVAPAAAASSPGVAAAQAPLPKPPAGLPRPPMIKAAAPGTPRAPTAPPNPAIGTGPAAAAPRPAPAANAPHARSATIMGMPAVTMPPASGAGVVPVATPSVPVRPQPAGSPITPVARPTPTPVAAPPLARTTPGPAPGPALNPIAQVAAAAAPAVAAVAAPAIAAAVKAAGHDPRGVEYEAIAKLSREIIERIAWEVVPDLAESIIKQHLDKLVAARS